MKIKFNLSTGLVSKQEVEIDTEELGMGDNPTDKEINEAFTDWANNYIDY